jgi:hypothetical protein
MHRTALKSTSLLAAGYDGITRTLEVESNDGRVYQYRDVPMEVYHDLLEAESPGHFLDQRIKKAGYAYRRMT